MARLKPIEPTQATGRIKEIYDGPLKGKHFNIFKSIANSPTALDAYLALSGAMKHASLSAAEREIVQLTVGQANNCEYCVAAHTAIGKSVGLTDAQTLEARRGSMADPRHGALARFVSAVHEKRGNVSDADLAAFRGAGFSDASVAEVVAEYALATFTNFFNHINQTPVDFPPPPRL